MKIKAPCAFCGKELEIEGRVGRSDECFFCKHDLHSCMQCRFYDRSYHNDCKETQSGYIADKEQSNFCEFFEFGRDVEREKIQIDSSKKKLDELFKK